jgi:hypothetical protein
MSRRESRVLRVLLVFSNGNPYKIRYVWALRWICGAFAATRLWSKEYKNLRRRAFARRFAYFRVFCRKLLIFLQFCMIFL